MTSKERLQGLQAKLVANGVEDIKFCFAPFGDRSLSQVADGASDVIEAYLAGNKTPLPDMGDSQRA